MELEQLKQLAAIADSGTLSAASEQLHLSQSAISRSIQKLEGEFGCTLFDRTKNRMHLNDAGEVALRHARMVLSEATRLEEAMAEIVRKQSSLHVGACAPAPLWRLVPMIAEREPELLVVPKLEALKDIESDLMNRVIDLAIMPYEMKLPNTVSIPFMTEQLRAVLPSDHALAARESIRLSELDGETFLMYHGVGFWRELLESHVPNAHYVLQDDYLVFSQLAQTSPLPGFVTDASETERFIGDRKIIRITDEEATAHYHLVALSDCNERLEELLDWVRRRVELSS